MTDDKQASARNTESDAASIRASRTSVLVALISAVTSLGCVFLVYFLTERVRNDLAAQTLALERIKVDIATSAQGTSEMVAKIDEARLQLERQIAASTERLETRKVQIEGKRSRTEEVRLTPD